MIIDLNNKEILDESVMDYVKPIAGKAVRFYQHMLKWKWYKNDNEEKYTSWINTITEANKTINKNIYKNGKLQTNVVNRSNDELYNLYIKGIQEASEELAAINFAKLDKDEIYNDFNDVRLICDNEYLKKWLLKYTSYKYKDIVYKGFDDKDD